MTVCNNTFLWILSWIRLKTKYLRLSFLNHGNLIFPPILSMQKMMLITNIDAKVKTLIEIISISNHRYVQGWKTRIIPPIFECKLWTDTSMSYIYWISFMSMKYAQHSKGGLFFGYILDITDVVCIFDKSYTKMQFLTSIIVVVNLTSSY